MFKKILTGLGVGTAKVEATLHKQSYLPGENLTGEVLIYGATTAQEIGDLTLRVVTDYARERRDYETKEKGIIAQQRVSSRFYLQPHEQRKIAFSLPLSYETPASIGNQRIRLETILDTAAIGDSTDTDDIYIQLHPFAQRVLTGLEQIGFKMYKVDCDSIPRRNPFFMNRQLPFAQEFEFKSVGGEFGKIEELEVIFIPYPNQIDVLFQVDTYLGRGRYGTGNDETYANLRLTEADLNAPDFKQKLGSFIKKEAGIPEYRPAVQTPVQPPPTPNTGFPPPQPTGFQQPVHTQSGFAQPLQSGFTQPPPSGYTADGVHVQSGFGNQPQTGFGNQPASGGVQSGFGAGGVQSGFGGAGGVQAGFGTPSRGFSTGKVKVDTRLQKTAFMQGETVTGEVRVINGGTVQEFPEIRIKTSTRYNVERAKYSSAQGHSFFEFKLLDRFTLQPNEEKVVPFSFQLPLDAPVTSIRPQQGEKQRVWVQTMLGNTAGEDGRDDDLIEVHPHPFVQKILNALQTQGFRLYKMDCERDQQRTMQIQRLYAPNDPHRYVEKHPYEQEFEFRASGDLGWKLEELEVIFRFLPDQLEMIFQIDRHSRAQRYGQPDETYIALRLGEADINSPDLPRNLSEFIRSRI